MIRRIADFLAHLVSELLGMGGDECPICGKPKREGDHADCEWQQRVN